LPSINTEQQTGANATPVSPLTVRINDAASMLGLSRSSIYNLANDGRLRIVRIAGRSLVVAQDIHNLVAEAVA